MSWQEKGFDFFERQDQSPDRFALDCLTVLRKFPSDAPTYPAVDKLLNTTAQVMDQFAPRIVITKGGKQYIGEKPKFEDYQNTPDFIHQVIFIPPDGNGLNYLSFAIIDPGEELQPGDIDVEFSYVADDDAGNTYRSFQSIYMVRADPNLVSYSAHFYKYKDTSIDEIGIVGQGDPGRYPQIEKKCIEAFDAWGSGHEPLEPEVGSSHADMSPDELIESIVKDTLFPPFR